MQDITSLPYADRELMLIKVAAKTHVRRNVLDIASIFRAKTVDVSNHTITLEVLHSLWLLKALVFAELYSSAKMSYHDCT